MSEGDSHIPHENPQRWLKNNRRLVLAGVIVASAMLRLVYFVQLGQGPCLWQHRWTESDMSFFHTWGTTIAQGDLLTDQAMYPLHFWHREVARNYLATYRDAALELERQAQLTGRSSTELLWEQWTRGKQFYQEPLYPYLVAGTYCIFGDDVRWVFLWQMLLGIGSNVLIYLLARRFFGDTVATVAAALAVLCAPMMFYELVLLRAAPRVFAALAVVYLTSRAWDGDTPRPRVSWITCGLVTGLGILLKSTFALYLAGVLCAITWRHRRKPRALAAAAGPLLAGVVICFAPVIVRNVAVGSPPLSLAGAGVLNFVFTNAYDFEAGPGYTTLGFYYAPEIMRATDGQFALAVIKTLRTHPGPVSIVVQLWTKFTSVWHWYEIPNNTNFYFYRLHAPVLGWMPVRFLLVAPLGIVGMVVAWRRFVVCWPHHLLAVVSLATLVAFGNLSRYRIVLLASLIVFAAFAVVQLVTWARTRRWVAAAVGVTATLVMGLFVARPTDPAVSVIGVAHYVAPLEYYYIPEASSATDAGDHEHAAEILADFLVHQPKVVREMGDGRPAVGPLESGLAQRYAAAYLNSARYLDLAGRTELAREHRQRGEALRNASP